MTTSSHHLAGNCDNIHSPTKLNILISSAKITLLTLVGKYKIETNIIPKCKNCFSCTKLQYLKWSTKELQRWFGTARKILQRYKRSLKYIERTKATFTYYTIYDSNNNIYLQTTTTIHTIYKASRTHHLKASPIKKYYHSSKKKYL